RTPRSRPSLESRVTAAQNRSGDGAPTSPQPPSRLTLLAHAEGDEVARAAELLEAAIGREHGRVAPGGHHRRTGPEADQRVRIVDRAYVLAIGVEGEARPGPLVLQAKAGEGCLARAEHGRERRHRGTRAAGMERAGPEEHDGPGEPCGGRDPEPE